MPAIVFQEVLSGVRGTRALRRLERALEGFDLNLADRDAHRDAAQIANACQRGGVATSAVDCLIASQTIRVDGQLFSTDQDFPRIARHCALKLYQVRERK